VILFTEYYTPAYKAGGLITSISNLCALLSNQLSITLVSSAYDLNDKKQLLNILYKIESIAAKSEVYAWIFCETRCQSLDITDSTRSEGLPP
jgi:hypothetical protein